MDKICTKFITAEKLPLVIEPKKAGITPEEFRALLSRELPFFKENLLKYGALLLRNFPVHSAEDFAAVLKQLQLGAFDTYIGGDSPRNKIIEGVFTSTEAPPSIKIPLHNELSYVNRFPRYISFYCETPPVKGGETIISDARRVYQAMGSEVRERFSEKGLRYISRYPCKNNWLHKIVKGHKSWATVFETEERSQVEEKCREHDFSFIWRKNDWIEISQKRPAVMSHPETGEKVWFNQAHLYDFNRRLFNWWQYIGIKLLYCRKETLLHEVFFADDSPIDFSDVCHVMDVLDKESVYFSWQKGDVLILDNILSMHGRATFQGKRRILTSMLG